MKQAVVRPSPVVPGRESGRRPVCVGGVVADLTLDPKNATTMTPGDTLRLDKKNANKGTVRGRGMLERSLQQYGAGRAPVASADGVILAGNKTIEVARELGIPVQEIESDGKTLFVIRRTDLPYDDPRARELAIADNRSGEVSLDWDADVLTALQDDGIDLEQFWFPEELDALLAVMPGDGEWASTIGSLPDGPEPDIEKMVFFVATPDVPVIRQAIADADSSGAGSGQALATIARSFLNGAL